MLSLSSPCCRKHCSGPHVDHSRVLVFIWSRILQLRPVSQGRSVFNSHDESRTVLVHLLVPAPSSPLIPSIRHARRATESHIDSPCLRIVSTKRQPPTRWSVNRDVPDIRLSSGCSCSLMSLPRTRLSCTAQTTDEHWTYKE